MIGDDGLISCDAPKCKAAPVGRDEFEVAGGVFVNHTSFFATRDEKHACSPDCAQAVIAELARDMVAYGTRQPSPAALAGPH